MQENIHKLLKIMENLRDKESGCPWDIEQNFESIAPYTIEEAYEVADAIDRGNMQDLKEELGDLLLQVVFHAQMAKEEELFDFNDVVQALSEKLIFRHPHVFGDESGVSAKNAQSVEDIWNRQKDAEKGQDEHAYLLDSITRNLPSLVRAQKIQKKAMKAGFDWPSIDGVFEKLEEEKLELQEAIRENDKQAMEDELGDLLFVCGILGRWLDIDAETALKKANDKFVSRFNAVEQKLRDQDTSLDGASLDELDRLWNLVKEERKRA
jgi:MazG family protein